MIVLKCNFSYKFWDKKPKILLDALYMYDMLF